MEVKNMKLSIFVTETYWHRLSSAQTFLDCIQVVYWYTDLNTDIQGLLFWVMHKLL